MISIITVFLPPNLLFLHPFLPLFTLSFCAVSAPHTKCPHFFRMFLDCPDAYLRGCANGAYGPSREGNLLLFSSGSPWLNTLNTLHSFSPLA